MNGTISKPSVANWGVWAEMPAAELWQAVLLSVGLSPDDTEQAFNWLHGSENQRVNEDLAIHSECVKRLKIAQAQVQFGGPIAALQLFPGDEQGSRTKIGLQEFASWATSKKWSLPIKFPGASTSAD